MQWFNVCKIDGGWIGECKLPLPPKSGDRVGLFGGGEIVVVEYIDENDTIWVK